MLAKLEKLRGKSLHEFQVRGTQELAKLGERFLAQGMRELSDAELFKEFAPVHRQEELSATVKALTARWQQPRPFFPAHAQRAEVVSLMETRFAEQRGALLARADRVLENRFDLFGYTGLQFTGPAGEPVDWLLEPQTGKRTPLAHWSQINFLDPAIAGDKKFTWELNRQQFFVTLGQAYWLTGDEKYAAQFVALLNSWLDANPPKRGINWASSLELAFRCIAWLWALHLFAEAKALTPAFVGRVLKSLLAQGRQIETYLSHYFSPNTHLTGEALGLFYLGSALPELRAAEHWRSYGLQILLEQLPRHVRGDGVYFEQASYYHRYTADFYTHLRLLCRAQQIPLPPLVEEKLVALHEHLLWLTRPDGSSVFYGDDDGGRLLQLGVRPADDFRDTLASGAQLFNRADWKFVAGAAPVELLWWLGPEALKSYDALPAQAPSTRSKGFGESGFYVMRDGWQPAASYVFIDCGWHGVMNSGHAHSDALAFEFAAHGVKWLVDPGTFSYTGDLQQRNEIRCSQNHSTVSVDGQSQSVPHTAFTWSHIAHALPREFRTTEHGSWFSGQQDGYTRLSDPVRQQRAWQLQHASAEQPLHLVVRDSLSAHAEHRYEWHFHFAAGCAAATEAQQVRVRASSGQELLLTARCQQTAELPFTIQTGWVSRCYGQREAAPVVNFALAVRGDFALETLLLPLPLDPVQRQQAERFAQTWRQTKTAN